MIDDHDKCVWVNVSSGTGSPGLSRTNPESRKTVVCVYRQNPVRTDNSLDGLTDKIIPYFVNGNLATLPYYLLRYGS